MMATDADAQVFLERPVFSPHTHHDNARTVRVEVPAGVDSGVAMKMPGEGAEGDAGAPRGDLYVQMHVESDPYFERDGSDVHVNSDISIAQVSLLLRGRGGMEGGRKNASAPMPVMQGSS